MTNSSQPPYFPTQYSGQYPHGPVQPPYYVPRPVFEGLTKGQKRAAAWAGAVGLNVMSFGGSVLVATLLLAILAVTFAGVSSSAEPSSGLQGFDEFLTESQAPLWLGAAAAVGVVALLVGMFLSVAILRAGRVRRPFAVTWSAFGITLPVLTVLNFIGGFLAQIFLTVSLFTAVAAGAAGDSADASSVTTGIVVAVVVVVLSVLIVGVIGWLAWWWMAHVYRERIIVGSVGGRAPRGRDTGSDGGSAAVFAGSDGVGHGRNDQPGRGDSDGQAGNGSGSGDGPGGSDGGWGGSDGGGGWGGGGGGGGDGGGGGGGGD